MIRKKSPKLNNETYFGNKLLYMPEAKIDQHSLHKLKHLLTVPAFPSSSSLTYQVTRITVNLYKPCK